MLRARPPVESEMTMGILSRKFSLVLLLLSFAALVATPLAQAAVLGYPSTEDARFLVDLPDDWEVEPGEGEGDYVHVNSPSGVYLAFRTLPGTEDAINEAIEDSKVYIQENYTDVKLTEPVKAAQAGLQAFYVDAYGKDQEDSEVTIRMAFIGLGDGLIGEIWFAAPLDDKEGLAAAGKVINSFRKP